MQRNDVKAADLALENERLKKEVDTLTHKLRINQDSSDLVDVLNSRIEHLNETISKLTADNNELRNQNVYLKGEVQNHTSTIASQQ